MVGGLGGLGDFYRRQARDRGGAGYFWPGRGVGGAWGGGGGGTPLQVPLELHQEEVLQQLVSISDH